MKAVLSLLFFSFCINASAQSVTTSVKFNKADKPALLLYLPYNQDVAEGTILTKLKETGFEPESKGSLFWKQNKVDGYYVFKGVALRPDSGTAALADLYFKVERRGSKKDNQSVIYMMTSKGSENFVTSSSEPATFNAAQKFLNGFVSETATYKHTLDIKAQEETVKKVEKKLNDLREDEKDMNKKIAKLQEDLKKNQQDQINQQAILEGENKKLADMKLVKQ
jgi:rubrerythrin